MALPYRPTEIPPARLALYDLNKNVFHVWHQMWRIG